MDLLRDQIIEHKVSSRMDQIFKSKDTDKRHAESHSVVISGQEELRKTEELSIPKIDLEKLGIDVSKNETIDSQPAISAFEKPSKEYSSYNNSYTDLPTINKFSKLSNAKKPRVTELRSLSVLHQRAPSYNPKKR